MIRPSGVAPGAIALAVALVATFTIAVLTGAAAVVILLALGSVGLLLASIAGGLVLRRVVVDSVVTDELSVVGAPLRWRVSMTGSVPVMTDLRIGGDVVASGIVADGETVLDGVAPRRGVHTSLEATWTSGGRPGVVIWRRRVCLPIAPLSVAPTIGERGSDVERTTSALVPGTAAGRRVGHDEPDGVRPWRDGDEVGSVHWPSSLRTGELIMRQQMRDADERWTVRARTGTGDSDGEAARVRRSLEEGLKQGARVAVRIDDGDTRSIEGPEDIQRWCAEFEQPADGPRRTRWWRRAIRVTAPEPDTQLSVRSRWFVALASAVPLVMLLEPLGYGFSQIAIVLAAVGMSAAVSRFNARFRSVCQLVGLATAALVAFALIDISQITSIATALRFFLPQVLVALVVLQGFECGDRRSARVSLACSALLIAYSSGLRVDGRLGPWLLVAAVCWTIALLEITRPDRVKPRVPGAQRVSPRTVMTSTAWLVTALGASLAVLVAVPIPRGPAQLNLPSWLEQRRPTTNDGGLASPDGSPLLGGASGAAGSSGSRGSSAGSYVGFSPEMDTSLRGNLGDEIVLRVRAPSPDFWRGQTYTYFDGRSWSVNDEPGYRTEGPDHKIVPSIGDIRTGDDEFIQTFYAEVDLPNLIFAASSARRVLLDAALWQRADGALRAEVVLPAGSAYTVVSARSKPTPELLRLDGDVSRFGAPPEYLQLPGSTTGRVRDLAKELSAGSESTYDTIGAIEQWMSQNVVYDLDAPAPGVGVDAVDDFLFESQRGFCEQIATATAVMLRSLGVPARAATGFVPSERDEIAGVWISRAKDAHAWVEVRFPNFGWVAFDPTASVPLSGASGDSTIGHELLAALRTSVSANVGPLLIALVSLSVAVASARAVRRWRARRLRGRWGLLQDRFVAAAVRRGAPPTNSNADLATVFSAGRAAVVAEALDASAFAPGWVDDDGLFDETAAAVRALENVGASGP